MGEPRYPAQAFAAGQGDPVPRWRRNSRRAYDREGREVRPMDLANASQNGVRSIRAICPPPYRHEVDVAIDRFPAAMSL